MWEIANFSLRAHYPNAVRFFRSIVNHRFQIAAYEGYLPPEVDYWLVGATQWETIRVRAVDVPFLIQEDQEAAKAYLRLLLAARNNDENAQQAITQKVQSCFEKEQSYYRKIQLHEDLYVIPSVSRKIYAPELVSDKGATLLNLSQKGYPVPDFSILTSETYQLPLKKRLIIRAKAIENLENLTGQKLGAQNDPLIFAIRCAMPTYIPGFMPTFLNVGVTETTVIGLAKKFGRLVANKIYLNNLYNIFQFFGDSQKNDFDHVSSLDTAEQIERAIHFLKAKIADIDAKLLSDPYYQTAFFIEHAHQFFQKNQELLFTFTKGKKHYPSLILQKMVCTVRDAHSYPGVLYSRHSRTGLGVQIESLPNIFGEEIMTGMISANDVEYFQREEIHHSFPAIYHFSPLLSQLEKYLHSPATVEFAVESGSNWQFFALLQLNASEMTGRASLLSALDLYHKQIISKQQVTELVKPYHLKQIISDAIDPDSFSQLKFFSQGLSILPRTAVSAQMYFSAKAALDAKKRGEKVCFCKETFVPADTLVMKEVDAIMSLTPAAIHVVTACRGLGVPAFLNLEQYGAQLIQDKRLINRDGDSMFEGDWITISSRRQAVYKGRAAYQPARFLKYLDGEQFPLEPKEAKVFSNLSKAYLEYQGLVRSLEAEQIDSLNSLIKIIRNEFNDQEDRAHQIVNDWFDSFTDYYVEEILQSELGTHLEQHRVYNLLTLDRKVQLFKQLISRCLSESLSGFDAGSFMLGRFICNAHPIAFWDAMNEAEVLFLLNEWLLFEKYIYVLNEIGEQKLKRVEEHIRRGKSVALKLTVGKLKNFMQLKLSSHDLFQLHCQANTLEVKHMLILLQKPFSAFYDYHKSWSLAQLQKICDDEGIELPPSDSY